jgi:hypothetical protein
MDPLHPNVYKDLEKAEPPSSPMEADALENDVGFLYIMAIGELLFVVIKESEL